MIRGVCDDWHRPLARLYTALEVECGCCTFYRGVLLGGAIVGIAFGIALTLVRYFPL